MKVIPKKNIFHLSRLGIYFFAILCIYIPNLDYLMSTSICYWYNNYQLLCPMCGGTRSFLNFMHLRFYQAFLYNSPLTLGLYPIMLFLILQDSYTIIANSFFNKNGISLLLYFMNLFNRRKI